MTERFTRREVNRGLLLGALALAAPGAAMPRPLVRTPLFDFAVAGGYYHGLDAARGSLLPGVALHLQAEPTNPYDGNAVAVQRSDGLMLGYVPRAANEPVARLLKLGRRLEAVVVGPLRIQRAADIPADLAFTGLADGDPRIRLTLIG